MGELPVTITGADMQTVMLLGLWIFVAIQFNKGKVWPDTWTGRISLLAPFALAPIPVIGGPTLNAVTKVMTVLYLMGVGFWAINKAGNAAPQEPPK